MMSYFALLLLFSLLIVARGALDVSVVQSLIDRVLSRASVPLKFNPRLIIDENSVENEYFMIYSEKNTVCLRSNTLVGLSAAFGHYLRYVVKADFHWENAGNYSFDNIDSFPLPNEAIKIIFDSKLRYYENTCTASYSFVFNNWKSYEQEIDWMLMNGLNMPLAHHGQEYVWRALYYSYNLTSTDLEDFFAGPAFLTWQRMANIRKFGGPLSNSFIDAQYELQRLVLQRYKEFALTPVLPAFNGVVPPKFYSMYPDSVQQMGNWNNFPEEYCCSYIIDASNPLFVEMGAKFIKLYDEIYNTLSFTHYYNIDTFNENKPLDNTEAYLYENSNAVYNSIVASDPKGIWIMQAWLFVDNPTFWQDDQIKYYLSGVPDDALILLDLTSEETPIWNKIAANNKPFIWCMLHNYGGARSLYGDLTNLYLGTRSAKTAYPSLYYGIGLTMEAINQNPVQYSFMTAMAYTYDLDQRNIAELSRDDVDNALTWPWLRGYVQRRYSLTSDNSRNNVEYAWNLIWKNSYSGVVNCGIACCLRRAIIVMKPGFELPLDTTLGATNLVDAWEYILQVEAENQVNAYRYDVVDVTRQVLANIFIDVYKLFQAGYARRDLESVQQAGTQLLNIIESMDELLGTHNGYLLGTWLETAKQWGKTVEEKQLFEYNGRNQLTLWGPNGEINDYASKNWQGLVGDYYYSRWELFINSVVTDLKANEIFQQEKYLQLESEIGQKFCAATDSYPTVETGTTRNISYNLQYKYGNLYRGNSYRKLVGQDVAGHDIIATWTVNIQQLKYLCDVEPTCLGFTSNGYLKASNKYTANVNTTLYIKH